jgi:hypothetical protein
MILFGFLPKISEIEAIPCLSHAINLAIPIGRGFLEEAS